MFFNSAYIANLTLYQYKVVLLFEKTRTAFEVIFKSLHQSFNLSISRCLGMYLMSRFRITTAQTRQFPTMLVMMSMDVTVVMAMSADADMSEGRKS